MRCTELSNADTGPSGCVLLQIAAEHIFLKETCKRTSIIVITNRLRFHPLPSRHPISRVLYLCRLHRFPVYRPKCHHRTYWCQIHLNPHRRFFLSLTNRIFQDHKKYWAGLVVIWSPYKYRTTPLSNQWHLHTLVWVDNGLYIQITEHKTGAIIRAWLINDESISLEEFDFSLLPRRCFLRTCNGLFVFAVLFHTRYRLKILSLTNARWVPPISLSMVTCLL